MKLACWVLHYHFELVFVRKNDDKELCGLLRKPEHYTIIYKFLAISSFLKIVSHNFHLNTFHKFYQTQWKIYKSASSNFYGSWLSFPGHEQSRKFVLGTPKILSPARLLKGFLPRCRTCRLETVHDFLIKLGIKQHMHLLEISILT